MPVFSLNKELGEFRMARKIKHFQKNLYWFITDQKIGLFDISLDFSAVKKSSKRKINRKLVLRDKCKEEPKNGKKSKNNGVVMLIKSEQPDRGIFIATGYGTEGALPDILAGQIIRNTMGPFFREKKYYEGIDAGTNEIIKALSGEFKNEGEPGDAKAGMVVLVIFLIVFFLILFFVFRAAKRGARMITHSGAGGSMWGAGWGAGSGWGGGGSSGGSSWGGGSDGGSFGGGSFGGGGAGGDW
jgi:uncharacterized protein